MFLGGLDGRAPVDDADGARDANFRAAGDVFDYWSDNRTDGAEDGALAMGGGVIELEVILKYDAIDPLFRNDYIRCHHHSSDKDGSIESPACDSYPI